MNEHELDQALRAIGMRHVRRTAPSSLHELAMVVPSSTPERRRWLLFPTWEFPSLFSAARLVVASAIVALFGGLLLAGVLTQPRSESVPAASAPASASPTASLAGGGLATDDAWWYGWDGGVARIDAATSEELIIPTASETAWLLPTDDAIWALGTEGVYRIDRDSLSVTDSIEVPGGPAIASDGSLWLWSMGPLGSSLVEIDLETRTIHAEYVVDDEARPGADDDSHWATYPRWIGTIDGAIWLHEWLGEGPAGSFATGQRVTRFDPKTRAFTDRTNIDETGEYDRWSCCTALDDAIWLPGPRGSGSLLRFDTATLEVSDTLVLDSGTVEFGIGPGPGIAAAGAIWATSPGTVHRIDPVTREVSDIAVVTFRNRAPGYGDGAIWIAGGSTLSRIDVDSLEVSEVPVTTTPECRADDTPAVANGVAWIWAGGGYSCRVDLVTGDITRIR